ncbi:MAG: hypothetical protein E6I80_17735 [Chloroflexi bacterium]|nr:MAG: hypothetical protein E6I80_17735 [Chloroflexota bacterium]
MPKKTTSTRGGAQRNRPKVQKNIELVRQVPAEQELEDTSNAEPAAASVTAVAAPAEDRQSTAKRSETKQSEAKDTTATTVASPKGSAAARVASRRQATQKAQQRAAATLVTAEHYAYVRQDLRLIAILATIMFSALIILSFVPGIGR